MIYYCIVQSSPVLELLFLVEIVFVFELGYEIYLVLYNIDNNSLVYI